MKLKLFILMLVLLFDRLIMAANDNHQIDSLEKLLTSTHVSEKTKILNELAFQLYKAIPEKSKKYAERALIDAQKTNNTKEKAFALNTLALIDLNKGNLDNAFTTFNQSLRLYEKIDDDLGVGEELKNIGNSYFFQSNYPKAIEYYQKSLTIFTKIGDKKGMAAAINNLGSINYQMGNYEKAIINYLKASTLLENFDEEGFSVALSNVGAIYFELSNYQKTIEYYNRSLAIEKKLNSKNEIVRLLTGLGEIHHKINLYEEELAYYSEALKIAEEIESNFLISSIFLRIGNYYYETNHFQNSLKYYENALSLFEDQGRIQEIAITLTQLANVYAKFKNFDKAFTYLQKSLDISTSNDLKKEIIANYRAIAEVSFLKGNYENAYLYHLKFYNLSDSLFNEESKASIAEIQAKYETENILKTITLQEKEIKRKNFQIYIFVFGFILTLIFAIILLSQNKIIKEKNEKIKIINTELEKKLDEDSKALELTQYSIDNASFIILWLSPDGKILYANIAACKLLEYSSEELLFLKISDIDPKFPENTWEKYWQEIKEKKSMIIETNIVSKQKKTIPVEVTLNFAELESKEHCFAFFQNITKRKIYESELKEAKEKAEESDKLKSAFLANMSHEIRTPMNAIIGFSQLLLNTSFTLEKKQDFINEIKHNGNALLNLVDNIIDISMIESGQIKLEKTKIPIHKIMSDIYTIYSQKLHPSKTIELKLSEPKTDKTPVLITDSNRFAQIMSNLIENALKFTDQGYIEIGYNLKDNNIAEFFVKDTGIGIPHNQQKLIFDIFNKINSDDTKVQAGAGLGLTISRNLVNLLGGKMWIDSAIGKGSTIYFTLPYFTDEESEAKSFYFGYSEKNTDWSDKKILIVEDVEANYLFLEAILEKTHAKLLWARDGKEAVQIFKTDKNIDMILMDIQLPVMNGFQATEEIRKFNPDIPIIAQTAYAFKGEKEKSFQAGCNDYVTKPIRKEILYTAMSKYFKI